MPLAWYRKKQSMPPVEWFDAPYDLPPASHTTFDNRKEFLIWFWLHWLPAAGGASNWPFELRKFRLHVQPVNKVAGKEHLAGPHVTIEREAFATIVTKNCHSKWGHLVPKKIEDKDFEIPKYDEKIPDTHKWHKTLWSDGRNGQVKAAGWAPEAYDELNNEIKKVKGFRKTDKAAGWTKLKEVLQWVKIDQGIDLGQKEPSKKKRKGTNADKPPPKYSKILCESDVECEEEV